MVNWIKTPPNHPQILFQNYKHKHYFKPIAKVVLDNDMNKYNKKKRQTLIKFIPLINQDIFKEKSEWIYIFTINGKIVKIGGSRVGLYGRIKSYLCGHHTLSRGKSGDCSKTNGFIYNTFYHYLNNNSKIFMYGLRLQPEYIEKTILDTKIKIKVQTYHAFESIFLLDFKISYGFLPYLNDKCDPDYW